MPFMPGMFRSEEMTQCQLFLQTEAAYAIVSELGELGIVQFKDLNADVNNFQRKFVNEVRRCEEMERKLRYIEREVRKEKMRIPRLIENPRAPPPKEMVDLEATFEKVESELREVNTNAEQLKRNFQELTELKEVLMKSSQLFGTGGERSFVEEAHDHLVEADRSQGAVQLGFVAGVIPREKCFSFEKITKRCTRNNTYFQYLPIPEPLEDPVTGDPVYKDVFVVFFQGEQLKNIVRKVCDGFKVSLYPCPESQREREEMLVGVAARLEDLKLVLNQTSDHRHRVLAGAQKELRLWITKVEKIKYIYHTLNMFNFDVSHNSLIAECWSPMSSLELFRAALKNGEKTSGSHIPSVIHPMTSNETPPTFFRTNIFTKGFQNIVSAYGMAEYQEVNPAPYTIISFPFLFAVMFGDTGHGALMFLFGLWMVVKEKKFLAEKSDSEIWNTFFGGRYIILLMGLFSLYTGMIYNDTYSKSFNIFGTSWFNNSYPVEELETGSHQLNPVYFFVNQTPYPFGIDPAWQSSLNKITFMNSFKMKSAIIMGVIQMLFGIILSIFNNVHFRKPLDFFTEFIPEFIFLMSLFGYLVSIVYYKWVYVSAERSSCAPALLIHYINMFMFKYGTDDIRDKTCDPQLLFYDNQQNIQTALVILAVISAPWLLVIKPFVLRAQHNKRRRMQGYIGATSTDALLENEHHPDQSNGGPSKASSKGHSADIELGGGAIEKNQSFESPTSSGVKPWGPAPEKPNDSVELLSVQPSGHDHPDVSLDMSVNNDVHPSTSKGGGGGGHGHGGHGEEFEFGEVFIHQAIHTIEFCLGCISHTASYLRLWALSLAHAQLAEVLWNMVLRMGLTLNVGLYVSAIPLALLWWAWGVLTVAVLLAMEGLSAFLHTLRLHWVEFQSKFYHGTGYKFSPFSFKEIMNMETLEDGSH